MQIKKTNVSFIAIFLVTIYFAGCCNASNSTPNNIRSTRNFTTDEWSQNIENEITNLSVLFDDLNESLLNLLQYFTSDIVKSRHVRDTFSDAFTEATLCEISEDELNLLVQLLANIYNNSTQISRVNIQNNINNCSRLILEIKNLIIDLKNSFFNLQNMQASAQNFSIYKQNYEIRILELQRKVDDLQRRSTQVAKTQLDRFVETTQRLKQESLVLLRNLENERTVHRNTKIQLCIAQIKVNEGFSVCIELFKSEWNNKTLISNVISSAYASNVDRILPVLGLLQSTPYYVTIVSIYESLLEQIFRNGHQYSPLIFQVHLNLDLVMNLSNYHTLDSGLKLRFENAKTKSQSSFQTVISTWASRIRSENFDSIIQFELAHDDAFLSVAERLVEVTYLDNVEFADKFITFLHERHIVSCITKMTKKLFHLMKSNNHIVTPQGMRLARRIKLLIASDSFSSYTNNIQLEWNGLKNEFPCGIKTLFWTDAPTVKSMHHNEYLYPASDNHLFGDRRRRVFTWRPGNDVWGSNWRFETSDGKYFTMYNTYYKEYLYAANNELAHDNDRRVVLTWVGDTVISDKFVWEVIPRDRSTFFIRNKHFNEYLYSADYQPYDNDRRRVFTWRPGDLLGYWNLGECESYSVSEILSALMTVIGNSELIRRQNG